MRCTAFKYTGSATTAQNSVEEQQPEPLEETTKFTDIPEDHATYARHIVTRVSLGTDYQAQEQAWLQDVNDATGNTPIQNQLLQNVALASNLKTFPNSDVDAAWLDYLDWLNDGWSGFSNAFLGYQAWWLQHGSTQHPNASIAGLL